MVLKPNLEKYQEKSSLFGLLKENQVKSTKKTVVQNYFKKILKMIFIERVFFLIFYSHIQGIHYILCFFSKNSRKFATSPSPALGCYWLYKKWPANRSDCTLAMRWELRRFYNDLGEGGVALNCGKHTIFPEHPVSPLMSFISSHGSLCFLNPFDNFHNILFLFIQTKFAKWYACIGDGNEFWN